ncbi:MAG: hypothetical protein NTX50_31290 [Candidatus Sumerlaeota bacterium]|nr:hypothetical protein [Candidatus Sumerlaeota bacterium]
MAILPYELPASQEFDNSARNAWNAGAEKAWNGGGGALYDAVAVF